MKQFILCLLVLISFNIHQLLAQKYYPCRVKSEYHSDWQFLGPKNTESQRANQHFGVVQSISVNPQNENEIYVGSGTSGLFYTNNQGKEWVCLTDDVPFPVLGIHQIIVDYRKTPHTIAIATGTSNVWYDAVNFGILYSEDGGKNWTHKFPTSDGLFCSPEIKHFIIDSVYKKWYIASNTTIFRSDDEGEHWKEIFSSALYPNILKDANYHISSMLIGNQHQSIYFSTSRVPVIESSTKKVLEEASFIEVENCHLSSSQRVKEHTKSLKQFFAPKSESASNIIKITKPNPKSDSIYLLQQYEGSKESCIYIFDEETENTLSQVSPNKGHFYEDLFWFEGLKVNELNPAIMYVGFTTLNKSVDSGKKFNEVYRYSFGDGDIPHADIRAIYISKSSADGKSDHLFVGTDGGLSYSSNGGNSFINLNGTSLPITQFYGFSSSPFSGMISAGSQDNSVFSYDPQTKHWIFEIRGDGYDVEYSKLKPGLVYGQYNGLAIQYSSNDVAPFDLPSKGVSPLGSNKKTMAAGKTGHIYFSDLSFNILRKNNPVWEENKLATPHQVLAFAVSESDSNIVYLSSFWNKLYKSTDGGRTFAEITQQVIAEGQALGETRIHVICISPIDPNKVWISLGYLGDYLDICKPSKRVLYSSDGGQTWKDYSEGLPVYYVSDLVFVEGTSEALFASTFEGVYFRLSSDQPWKLFSDNLPKCIITELQINYCRGKLIASTYGRGLWETSLPSIHYDEPMYLNKNTQWSTSDTSEAMYITTDIVLKKHVQLTINCKVHMAKDKRIIAYKKNQVQFSEDGEIVNACGESWGGLQLRRKKTSIYPTKND